MAVQPLADRLILDGAGKRGLLWVVSTNNEVATNLLGSGRAFDLVISNPGIAQLDVDRLAGLSVSARLLRRLRAAGTLSGGRAAAATAVASAAGAWRKAAFADLSRNGLDVAAALVCLQGVGRLSKIATVVLAASVLTELFSLADAGLLPLSGRGPTTR